MDLIDRNFVLNEYKHGKNKPEICDGDQAFDWLMECIYKAKIVDEEPVRHGRWLNKPHIADSGDCIYATYHDPECNLCGQKNKNGRTDYCPHCGAKMDLEQNENVKETD